MSTATITRPGASAEDEADRKRREHIARVVSTAPRLTPAQLDRLAVIFGNGGAA